MKKTLLLVSLLALLLASAAAPLKPVRLTIVNKSEMDIEVSLLGNCEDNRYFLRVPEGSRQQPTTKAFTITPDTYHVDTYYVELWDPVYGSKCDDRVQKVELLHQTTIIVLGCEITPPNAGEPPIIKLGGRNPKQPRNPR